jgi:hypothetical protein
MLIVSAASSNHAGALLNLIATAKHFAPEARVVAYDLGLSTSEAGAVAAAAELRRFDASQYPAHVADLKTFAWKPLVVRDALAAGEPVVWMDAGNLLHGPLDEVWDLLRGPGLYQPVHREPVDYWTRAQTFDRMGVAPDDPLRKLVMRHASIVGLAPARAALADAWGAAALDAGTIAPPRTPGIAPWNQRHHYDMSLLSILAYQLARGEAIRLVNRWIGVTRGNDALGAAEAAQRIASGWKPARPPFGATD